MKKELFHIVIIILGAAIAFSLPFTVRLATEKFLLFWSFVENEEIFLLTVEIAAAVSLFLIFNYAGKAWRNRRIFQMVSCAGLVSAAVPGGIFRKRKTRRIKEKTGFVRDIMILGSTGFRTFAHSEGDLHQVSRNCREARIMLLDPYSESAAMRAQSIPDPGITPELLRDQISGSIGFLKELRRAQKNIRLKFYRDLPLFKLEIMGDVLFLGHYHQGLDIGTMPEYMFSHNQNPGGLYSLFCHYFLSRWQDPQIPEYDLDGDELIYRDRQGNEMRREKPRPVTEPREETEGFVI